MKDEKQERTDLAEGNLQSPSEAQKASKAANDILDFVNSFTYDEKTFAWTIAHGHKTLQQSAMRLFIASIRAMSKVTPDDRNAATVALAKRIADIAEDYPLPLI